MCVVCYKFWHLCLKQEDKTTDQKTKEQAVAMTINVLWYNGFMHMFSHHFPFLWEKTGPIHLALVGLMVGWQAGRWSTSGFQNL